MKRRGNEHRNVNNKSTKRVAFSTFSFDPLRALKKRKKEIKVKKREGEKGKRRFLTIVIYEHFRGVDELARDIHSIQDW